MVSGGAKAEMTLPNRVCPSCGQKNRVPARHLAHSGRCGSCKAELPPTSEPIDVDKGLFNEIIAESRVPVLVDFWAHWCGPCRMVAPELRMLAEEMSGKALVLKVDTEANPDLAARYKVQSIPNFVVIRNGRVAMQQAGAAPLGAMRQWLEI